MEALIPKLFILTAEASIVLLLILIIMIIFNIKAKRKDMKAANELVSNYTGSKEERIAALKKQLAALGFKGNSDEQAEKLFQVEKNVIKEFVTLYLRHDIYRLLDYPENIIDNNYVFLKTSGSGQSATVTAAPESVDIETSNSEETANATILAREQAESNDAHLKELSELRLKNTELNEHLFEALETITTLMTEHGRKTGQEVESNAQKVLEAIIYLRDQRLENSTDPGKLAPSASDDHDQVDSFNLDSINDLEDNTAVAVNLDDNDATLDDSTAVNLGINDELNMDLDALDDETQLSKEPETVEPAAGDESKTASNAEAEIQPVEEAEGDPWADALAEQASSETEVETQPAEETEEDPWADALAEQASSETEVKTQPAEETEEDPWADALAEQASSETEVKTQPAEEAEEDPWADALAEQATAEAEIETQPAEETEEDPWADALAEQATAEAETQPAEEAEKDPWAAALAEQEESEKK